ncbi:MAG: GNAT family N-acetyltransferase [Desulfobacteraceae bacterium]
MQEKIFHIYPATEKDCKTLADIITDAFRPVARKFELTTENCPKHPSNCTAGWIATDFKRGVKYFILETHGIPIGCVGLEVVENSVCYMERLAVRPLFQNKGAGKKLVDHIIQTACKMKLQTVSIGIIAADQQLKNWYANQAFIPSSCKHFTHLPFEVQFMFHQISS